MKTYNITFGVYDDYLEAEKATTTRDVKQAELENLGIHFLLEFDTRSANEGNNRGWFRLTGDGEELPQAEFIENMGDQKLFGYELTFLLQVPDECTTGTFVY